MIKIVFLPPVMKYFKKLKDKQLKKLFQHKVDEILADPLIGEEKKGDLRGIRCCDIYYNRTNYELAYTLEYVVDEVTGERTTVIVIMTGTREKLYDELKRYWL